MGFLDLFRRKSRSLESALNQTFSVKVHGVFFKLRKLNPIDYMSGAKALHMQFETYKTATDKARMDMVSNNSDKIREHYVDVFMASVVEPKLTRKEGEPGIYVENLFTDWDLANELYVKILEITYGKKKLRPLLLQKTG